MRQPKSRLAHFLCFLSLPRDNTHLSILVMRNYCYLYLFVSLFVMNACRSDGKGSDSVFPSLPQIPDREVTLTDFGAVAGDTCSEAFVSAIHYLDSLGGGTLHVPAGEWFTGPIILRSHIELNLQKDAYVKFLPEMSLYQSRDELFGTGEYKRQAPIVAYRATDIAITGEGVIDGSGEFWRPIRKEYATEEEWAALVADTIHGVLTEDGTRWAPIGLAERAFCRSQKIYQRGKLLSWQHYKTMVRPENLWLYECERVLLEGVTFQNSPMWNLHPELCRELTIRRCNVQNEWYATNGDGLDLESCSHVLVQECTFDVGDDAICLKSGADEAGRKRGRPTEEVLVEDCKVSHAHGGFVVGSEMSGGVRNVHIRRCSFVGTDSGLRFKTNRQRGGLVKNISVEDIDMTDIKADALLFDMYYHGQSPVLEVIEGHSIADTAVVAVTEATPCFKGIHFRNIRCRNVGRTFYFDGIHEMPVQDITIDNLFSEASAPSLFSECKGIVLRDISFAEGGNQQIYLYRAEDITASDDIRKCFKDLEKSK